MNKLVKTVIIIYIIIVITITCLSISHPLLRTVEPQVITYNVLGVDQKDEKLVFSAIETAFMSWEDVNPNLTFEYGDGGMTIIFTEYLDNSISGTVLCPFWSNSENMCVVFVSYDAFHFKHHLTNTIMHETGHVLGLGHADINGHLMIGSIHGWYGEDHNFDSGDYVVPEAFGWCDFRDFICVTDG